MAEKMIVLDMDGTIADLYGVRDWLEHLRRENALPYIIARPLVDMQKLVSLLNFAKTRGWTICVTSWLARDGSVEYGRTVRAAKKLWLDRYGIPYDHLHIVRYGTPKRYCTSPYKKSLKSPKIQVLCDDEDKNLEDWKKWHDFVIDAKQDLLQSLKNLVMNFEDLKQEGISLSV